MNKLLLLCTLFVSWTLHGATPQDLIQQETEAIDACTDNASLVDAYLSRGDSYIFLEEYAKARQDFAMAHAIAELVNPEIQIPTAFRSHFFIGVSCFLEGNSEAGWACFEYLKNLTITRAPPPHRALTDVEKRMASTLKQLFIARTPDNVREELSQFFERLDDLEFHCLDGPIWEACMRPSITKGEYWLNTWGG